MVFTMDPRFILGGGTNLLQIPMTFVVIVSKSPVVRNGPGSLPSLMFGCSKKCQSCINCEPQEHISRVNEDQSMRNLRWEIANRGNSSLWLSVFHFDSSITSQLNVCHLFLLFCYFCLSPCVCVIEPARSADCVKRRRRAPPSLSETERASREPSRSRLRPGE